MQTIPAAQLVEPSTMVRELQTRFLYPFTFPVGSMADVAGKLRSLTHPSGHGLNKTLWECSSPNKLYTDPHHFYRDELLQDVVSYLFDDGKTRDEHDQPPRNDALKGCGYLRVAAGVVSKWFHDVSLVKIRGKKGEETFEAIAPVSLANRAGIEVFLFPRGIGVLSIALKADNPELTQRQAADFNYWIAQYRRHPAARFRRRHRADPDSKVPPQHRIGIPSPPALDAPLEDRLGVEGGSFELKQLIGLLLGELSGHGVSLVEDSLHELSVYTVARLGPEVDFGDRSVRRRLGPFLAGLAQVEESGHSGAPPGEPALASELLNRRHWAAVGLLGAAHLIADQPPHDGEVGGPEFNEEKPAIIRDKYFMPFLIALMQRLALGPLVEEARGILVDPGKKAWTRSETLRKDLAAFAVKGYFPQVSVRHALHRWYKVAREGLDVPAAWEEVRRSIADVNSAFAAVRLDQNQQTANTISKKLVEAQEVVHRIEIFLVSVYAAHLTDMLAYEHDSWRGLYVATAAAFGALVAAFVVGRRNDFRWTAVLTVGFFAIASLLWAATTPGEPEPLIAPPALTSTPLTEGDDSIFRHFYRPSRDELPAWGIASAFIILTTAAFWTFKPDDHRKQEPEEQPVED